MQAERWRRIDRIFQSALKLDEGRRADFLEETCSGDEDLRREVERLLGHEKEAGSFLEAPALEFAAEAFEGSIPASTAGASAAGLVGEIISHTGSCPRWAEAVWEWYTKRRISASDVA
jgi:hypothetical protein